MRRPHGTREWLGALYDCHAAGLYRYAVTVSGHSDAAGDAVQQVSTRLVDRQRPEIEQLRRAIRNECFSMLRARRRRPQASDSHEILEEARARATICLEERLAIQAALLALRADQREVVHLKIFEGLTFQEIDVTGESINTIASRYRYALETRAVL